VVSCHNHVASAVTHSEEIIQFEFIVEVVNLQFEESRITHNLSIESASRTHAIHNLSLLLQTSGIRRLDGSLISVAFCLKLIQPLNKFRMRPWENSKRKIFNLCDTLLTDRPFPYPAGVKDLQHTVHYEADESLPVQAHFRLGRLPHNPSNIWR
jgi:hypothetical protein